MLLATLVPGINDSLEELDQSRDQTVNIMLYVCQSCAGVSKNYWDLNGYFWDMQTLMMWLSWKRSHWTNRSVGTVNILDRDLRGMKTSQKKKIMAAFLSVFPDIHTRHGRQEPTLEKFAAKCSSGVSGSMVCVPRALHTHHDWFDHLPKRAPVWEGYCTFPDTSSMSMSFWRDGAKMGPGCSWGDKQ